MDVERMLCDCDKEEVEDDEDDDIREHLRPSRGIRPQRNCNHSRVCTAWIDHKIP